MLTHEPAVPCGPERNWLAWRRVRRRVDPVATRRPPGTPAAAPSARELRMAPEAKGLADNSKPKAGSGCGGAGAHGSS